METVECIIFIIIVMVLAMIGVNTIADGLYERLKSRWIGTSGDKDEDDFEDATDEILILQAAFKEPISKDRMRNAFRGAKEQDWFKAVMQICVLERERQIADSKQGDSAEERAWRDGSVAALDDLRRMLTANVEAADKD